MRASIAEAARKRTVAVNFPLIRLRSGPQTPSPKGGKAQTAKNFPAKNPGQLTVSRPGMCFYFAPRPAKTTYTVLNKIFTSFQSDQLSM